MLLREHRTRRAGLADLLPWAGAVAPGVVVNKQGTLSAAFAYRAPDLESSTRDELFVLAHAVNRALVPLQNAWILHVDAIRVPSSGYSPRGAFPDPVTALIDEERRARYEDEGRHFESRYTLTLTWKPRTETGHRAGRWFVTGGDEPEIAWERELARFESHLERVQTTLGGHLELTRLDTASLVAHFHHCLTAKDHPIDVPELPFYLDQVLATADLYGGFAPRIGRKHCRVLSIDGFPRKSSPALLDFLHQLPVPFRWNTRWLPLDRQAAVRELGAYRRNWLKSRFGLFRQLGPAGEPDAAGERFANQDALSMYRDANQAHAEASSGLVTYGYYSNTVVLMDEEPAALDEAALAAERAIEQHGFGTRIEDVNALEALLGSLPANATDNVRRPLIHSLNLAHLMPLTGVFSGLETNPNPMYPPRSPPLFHARTTGATPFRGHLHVGDVGHALIVGPTGAGKSVLLALLAASQLRYPRARVFLFDRGYSALPLCLAAGGAHYDLAARSDDAGPSFAPLSHVDRDAERLWAADWLAALFEENKLTLEPRHHQAIHDALLHLGQAPPEDRTLTTLRVHLMSRRLREVVGAYTLAGDYGQLLDASHDGFAASHLHVFELSRLLDAGERLVAPALAYLFHRVQSRLDGSPTLILVDEAWSFLAHGRFGRQIRSWVKEARKKNAAVVLATQSLEDLESTPEAAALFESCPTKVFLPNEHALTPRGAKLYRALGLNDRQLSIIATAAKKRHYYWLSPLGRRLIDLELGPVALAFLGRTDPESLDRIARLHQDHGDQWPVAWLRQCQLAEAARDLGTPQPSARTTRKEANTPQGPV